LAWPRHGCAPSGSALAPLAQGGAFNARASGAGMYQGIFCSKLPKPSLYKEGEGSSLTHTIWSTTPHYHSSCRFSFSLISNSTLEQGLNHQGRLVSLEERILGMNSNIVSSKVMPSYLSYSCAIELEYSFHVIILTYELEYSLCVMILTCSFDMITSYKPDYSFYARVSSYKTLCLIIHAIYLLRFRAKYRCLRVCPCPMLVDP
jgi:hypothetical protein